jgi:hypothetical protein
MINGELPQAPISETMSFWITEIGDGFACLAGGPGRQTHFERGQGAQPGR